MPPSLRLFLAVDPPARTAAHARRVIASLARAGLDAAWVDPRTLHLTLHFLGNDVDPARLPAICRVVDRACGQMPPFDIEFGGVGAFPDTSHPRTIWLGVRRGAEHLARLHDAVCAELGPLGYPAEDRGYHPHLTLGRMRPGRRRRQPSTRHALTDAMIRFSDEATGQLAVHEVALYSSRLEPTGPVHTRVHTATLGGHDNACEK